MVTALPTVRAALVAAAIGCAAVEAGAVEKDQKAAATALFDEALKLMDAGRYAEACPKFAQSQELAPSGGTLLNLARCYEKNGQWASAWLSYKDASVRANAAKKRDMEKLASDAAKKLEPKLAKVTVTVRDPAAGIEVRRNGRIIEAAELGAPTPIDPGSYRIEASAPGKKPWSTTLEVPDSPKVHVVEVPPLGAADAPAAPVASSKPFDAHEEHPEPRPPKKGGSGQRALGIGVGVAGIIGVGVGAFFGIRAKNKNDDARAHCRTETQCDPAGLELDDQARRAATISTIGFAAGAGLIALGTVLYVSAPSGSSTSARLSIQPAGGAPSVRLGLEKSF